MKLAVVLRVFPEMENEAASVPPSEYVKVFPASGSVDVRVPTVEPLGMFSLMLLDERLRSVGASFTSFTVMVKFLLKVSEP